MAEGKQIPSYTLGPDFTIQQLLNTIEDSLKGSSDPNAFIYLTKTMKDYFNLERDYGSLASAFSQVKGKTLLVSFDSDWRYPREEIDKIRLTLEAIRPRWNNHCLHSAFGHGAFLYDFHNGLERLIKEFLQPTSVTTP